MVLAGEAALGYICANFHAMGTDFLLIQDVLKYVYDRGKGPGPESDVGTAYWIRGMLSGFFATEAVRMERDHRLDPHGAGAGAAPGRCSGGQVYAGEGHHTAGLSVRRKTRLPSWRAVS
jgi:hypothetical protein